MYISYTNTSFADFGFRDLDITGPTKSRKLSHIKKNQNVANMETLKFRGQGTVNLSTCLTQDLAVSNSIFKLSSLQRFTSRITESDLGRRM